jgi:hypothetical protein
MPRRTSPRSRGASFKKPVCKRTRSGLGISPEHFESMYTAGHPVCSTKRASDSVVGYFCSKNPSSRARATTEPCIAFNNVFRDGGLVKPKPNAAQDTQNLGGFRVLSLPIPDSPESVWAQVDTCAYAYVYCDCMRVTDIFGFRSCFAARIATPAPTLREVDDGHRACLRRLSRIHRSF